MIELIKNKHVLLLVTIILAAFILRVWQLGQNPPSLYWDEVSQAVNSYSILTTGKDEHQEFLPLARFKAFGDYKAPVYIYADVFSLAVFGKNEFAVRFPSALFGTLTVFITFLLVRELFYKEKNREIVSLTAAFLLAISPWHIQLSRAAYEANIATFFTILAVWLFFYALRKHVYFLIFSAISFVLAFYAFNAHRIFIPLLIVLLTVLYHKTILNHKKQVIIAGIIGLVLLIPFFQYFQTPESKLRFQEVNIFSDLSVIEKANERIAYADNNIAAKVFDNRRVLFSMLFVKHYFDFVNPVYLFFTGDENPRFSLQDNGLLYLFELPFLLLGAYILLTARDKRTLLLGGWFLLAPIAAATARETPHALRSETLIPIYQIVSAIGIASVITLIQKSKKPLLLYLFSGVAILTVSISMLFFLHNYYIHFPVTYAADWQYGYKQAVEKSETLKEKYEKIVFTRAYGRPHIYVAWYGDYTPQEYWSQSEIVRDPFGFYEVPRLAKYEFRDIIISPSDNKEQTLYVITSLQKTEDMEVIDTVKFLNGEDAFLFAIRK